jgi:hypothetical protein
VKNFRLEGQAEISFPEGRMRLSSALDESLGQKANFVYWCDCDFPPDLCVQWNFSPLKEPGLCILFFAAKGRNGEDLFSPSLKPRTGEYEMYHHGDINAYHISYFRRKWEEERSFHTCNLRKSYGFRLVAAGADPIPSVCDAKPPYHMELIKLRDEISFSINGLCVLHWIDRNAGPVLSGGKIGFRQMAPLSAEYSALRVFGFEEGKKSQG